MSSPAPLDPTLHRARAGDPKAWRALITRHGPAVWTLCRRLTPDPEDAYQEVWEKIVSRLDRFDPTGPASLGTWIGTLARRHLIDRHRRGRVRDHLHVATAEDAAGRAIAADAGPESAAAQARARARLHAALRRLPADQRRVLVFHHLQGVALRTLADEEGVAVGTLKSRLHRGRAALAVLLGADR